MVRGATLGLIVLAAGCVPTPTPPRASHVVGETRILDSSGGSLTGSDGVTLIVPKGAVTRTARASIRTMPTGYDVHLTASLVDPVVVGLPIGALKPDETALIGHETASGFVFQDTVTVGHYLVANPTSLSIFDVFKCATKGLPGAILSCVGREGLKLIPSAAVRKIVDPVTCGDVTDVIGTLFGNEPCKVGESQEDLDEARRILQQQQQPPPTSPQTPPPTPAPSPSVGIGKGPSAVGQSGCSHSSCARISVNLYNFGAGTHTVACYSNLEAPAFYTYTTSSQSSAVCYFGYPGRTVWVIVDGVRSHNLVW
jgi:hypothetical protein